MIGLDARTWNRARYSFYARFYDRIVGFGRARRRAIELLSLQPGERVLIVGAGTGQDLDHLPSTVTVVAGDIAPGMLRRLRSRARSARMPVEVRELDAGGLDLPDGSFDAVLLHLVLAVVPHPAACMTEVVRVLREGGRISILDKFAPEGRPTPIWRRLLNPATRLIATSIDRRLGSLLAGLPLVIERREPAGMRGFLEVALLRKQTGAAA